MSALAPPSAAEAQAMLGTLVSLYRVGLSEPLPLAPKTSCAYAEHRAQGSPPKAAVAKAAAEWRKQLADGREFGDFDDAEHHRVWGTARLAELLVAPPRVEEEYGDEPHRFGQLARQVFGPLVAHEAVY